MVLRDLKLSNTVEVKSKFNKGLRWWKAIVTHKAKNNSYQYRNYSYELYNKMELDINNVSRDYYTKKKLLRIDLVWRNAPLRNIPPGLSPNLFKSKTNDFGIFGSVRLQF